MDIESVAHFEGLPGEHFGNEEPPECWECGGPMQWYDALCDWVCPFCDQEEDVNGESDDGDIHT